jgi:hypothetical protein
MSNERSSKNGATPWPTTRNSHPTLLLRFADPHRVPPLRLLAAFGRVGALGFKRRATRSSQGAWVDGVCLRAPDDAAAIEALGGAGVVVTEVPQDWVIARPARAELQPEESAASGTSGCR